MSHSTADTDLVSAIMVLVLGEEVKIVGSISLAPEGPQEHRGDEGDYPDGTKPVVASGREVSGAITREVTVYLVVSGTRSVALTKRVRIPATQPDPSDNIV